MKEKITKIILSHFSSSIAIYLFGSFGTIYERSDSDVDIAVLLDQDIGLSIENINNNWLYCKDELEELLNREIHLVNLNQANTVFQMEIINSGHILFEKDEYKKGLFETKVMSAYQKLNEERAQILNSIYQTGRIVA